ncbi:MAG: hypothetical protein A2075_22860 [Geobacteraceae bacterium GWC2_58_44]|nr:MAG: hypothetical protein A2075_22860 [Geobacteraceae bacterium GWC2_58_44]
MFIGKSSRCFQFDDQPVFDEEVGGVIAEECPVFVKDIERMLLFYIKPSFPKAMCQTVFINLFQMSVA